MKWSNRLHTYDFVRYWMTQYPMTLHFHFSYGKYEGEKQPRSFWILNFSFISASEIPNKTELKKVNKSFNRAQNSSLFQFIILLLKWWITVIIKSTFQNSNHSSHVYQCYYLYHTLKIWFFVLIYQLLLLRDPLT